MKIFPAIDLYNGSCVRLEKGDFATRTVFNHNPLSVAKQFEQEGAEWIHIVDLNGAETGNKQNQSVIKEIRNNTSLKIQLGGGIRDVKDIFELLNIGVDRVILGSYAVLHLEDLKELSTTFKERVIVSVDSKDGFVTYKGWQETSSLSTLDFCVKLENAGIKTIVYTDISKDGMMSGPNFLDYESISNTTSLRIIASGGVSSYEDIIRLDKMNLYGAIIGKAIYLNQMTVKEMISCLQEESYRV